MSPEAPDPSDDAKRDGGVPGEFERSAARKPRGLMREYVDFVWTERKWWLAPVLLFLLLASGFIVLGGSGLAPFIYAIF